MNVSIGKTISDELGKYRPETRTDFPRVTKQVSGMARVSPGRLHGGGGLELALGDWRGKGGSREKQE